MGGDRPGQDRDVAIERCRDGGALAAYKSQTATGIGWDGLEGARNRGR